MESLGFLNANIGESKRTLTTTALFWALSSFIVIICKNLGWFSSYLDALPFVIIVSWLSGEITARLPKVTRVSYCSNCKKIRILPEISFIRLWKWRHCPTCGNKLHLKCSKRHILSIPSVNQKEIDEIIEENKEKFRCTRCGESVSNHATLNSIVNSDEASTKLDRLATIIERNPEFYEPYFEVAKLLSKNAKDSNEFESEKFTLDFLHKAYELNQAFPEVRLELARRYIREGDVHKALAMLSFFNNNLPNDLEWFVEVEKCHYEFHLLYKYDEKLTLFRKYEKLLIESGNRLQKEEKERRLKIINFLLKMEAIGNEDLTKVYNVIREMRNDNTLLRLNSKTVGKNITIQMLYLIESGLLFHNDDKKGGLDVFNDCLMWQIDDFSVGIGNFDSKFMFETEFSWPNCKFFIYSNFNTFFDLEPLFMSF